MAAHSALRLLTATSAAGLMLAASSCQLPEDVDAADAGNSPTVPQNATVPENETDLPAMPEQPLLPLERQERTFEIVAGDDRGDRMPMILREARQGEPGAWVLEMDDLNILFLEEDDEGNVLIVRMDLPRDDYIIVYEPPVRLIPSKITPDLRVEEYARASVHDPETEEVQHTGEVTHTIKRVTRSRFHTPDGIQEGYMVVTEHAIDLGPADVDLEMEAGYLPGDGMVYRHLRYTVTRLGIFGNTTRRTAVLVDEPAQDPTAVE